MGANNHGTYNSDEAVIKALYASGGVIKQAMKALKLSDRSAFYARISASPELTLSWKESKEALKDEAESHLVKAIESGDMDTIKWFLPKKAKDRGYGNAIAITQEVRPTIDTSRLSPEKKAMLKSLLEEVYVTDDSDEENVDEETV